MFYDLLIGQVRHRLYGIAAFSAGFYPVLPFHKRIKNRLQGIIISSYLSGTIYITRNRYKAISSTGEIDLQSVLTVVYVVHRLIIDEIGRETEKTSQTGRTGRPFKVGIGKERENVCRHIVQRTVISYAVVNIYSTDALGHSVSYTIPFRSATHSISCHSCGEIRKSGCVICFCRLSRSRIIGHLRCSAASFFILPQAE